MVAHANASVRRPARRAFTDDAVAGGQRRCQRQTRQEQRRCRASPARSATPPATIAVPRVIAEQQPGHRSAGPRRQRIARTLTGHRRASPTLQSASSQPLALRLLLQDRDGWDADLDQSEPECHQDRARRTGATMQHDAQRAPDVLGRGCGLPERSDDAGEDQAADRAAAPPRRAERAGPRDRDEDADQGRAGDEDQLLPGGVEGVERIEVVLVLGELRPQGSRDRGGRGRQQTRPAASATSGRFDVDRAEGQQR